MFLDLQVTKGPRRTEDLDQVLKEGRGLRRGAQEGALVIYHEVTDIVLAQRLDELRLILDARADTIVEPWAGT